MATIAPHHAHRRHSRPVRARTLARESDLRFIKGATVALPFSLLLWLLLIWTAVQVF